jgi:WD and tetratricopeptide repeat-containing protein 1
MLLSGSDDRSIMLWDVYKRKSICKLETTHLGNIFSVKFMPLCNDSVVVSSAADNKICIYDVRTKALLHELTPHINRVKRLAVAQDAPHLFWSGGEDGFIMQHDIRCATDQISSILIDYSSCGIKNESGPSAFNGTLEVKCLDISESRSEILAVGCNDPYAR